MTASDSFSLHLYLLRISPTANQLSQPPVIYRTFLFSENHPPVSRYILGFTGNLNVGLSPVKPEVEGSSPFGPAKKINTTYLSIKASLNRGAFCFIFNHIYSFIPKMGTHFGGTHPSSLTTFHLGPLLHMAGRSAHIYPHSWGFLFVG